MRARDTSSRSFPSIFLLTCLVATLGFAVAAHAAERAAGDLVILRARSFDAGSRIPAPEALHKLEKTALFSASYVSVPAEVEVAFEQALDLWSGLVTSSVPITVEVQWVPLGPGVLGAAGASTIHRDFEGAPDGGTWYVDALADALVGVDRAPGTPDIVAVLSSQVSWYLGADANPPPGAFDLVTVALHEIAHGLGFTTSFGITNGSGSWGFGTGRPFVFDRWVTDGNGRSLVEPHEFVNPSSELAAALESGNLSFAGPRARAANGGAPPPLYAPLPWLDGLSLSHFDEAAFPAGDPSSLMTPFLAASEAIHDPGEVAVCVLADLGWQTTCQQLPFGSCVSSSSVLCIDDSPGDRRFRLTSRFETILGGGLSGAGRVVPLASVGQPRGGTISFLGADNPELLVKVLNGCQANGHYWVFVGAATNIGFELTVEDTLSGEVRIFANPDIHPADPVISVDAFEACP